MGLNATKIVDHYPEVRKQLDDSFGSEAVNNYTNSLYVHIDMSDLLDAHTCNTFHEALKYLLYTNMLRAALGKRSDYTEFQKLSLPRLEDVVDHVINGKQHVFLHWDEVNFFLFTKVHIANS